MNAVRVDALSLLTTEEPEEVMFVDWMLCAIFCLFRLSRASLIPCLLFFLMLRYQLDLGRV